MKKLTVALLVVLVASVGAVSAQSLDKILKNYFEVIGQETLLASKSALSTGKMIQAGMEIPFKQYAAAPAKIRVEASFQGLTLIQTYDGQKGWSLNPFAGMTEPQPMSEIELKSMEVQADYEGMLWNYADKGYTVTLEGEEDVEGTNCYVIKLVTEDDDNYVNYIDAENYVMIKIGAKIHVEGSVVESETYMSNFQESNGVIYPGKIETRVGGQVVSTIVIDEMSLNVDVNDAFFGKPDAQ